METLTLSATDGEALIARVSQSNLSAADARVVEQVVRMLLWVVSAVQEAQGSVTRLRTLLGSPSPTSLSAPASAAASPSHAPSRDAGASRGEVGSAPKAYPSGDAVGKAAGAGLSWTEMVPKPQGGHRPGTGRLGAQAYVGAAHIECRHEELAVGQRGPVCGQGTL
jgi:hypothetical protein